MSEHASECMTTRKNSDNSFSIQINKNCVIKNEKGYDGIGVYNGFVAYRFNSTTNLCSSLLYYTVNVKNTSIESNFTFNSFVYLD
jgi:hypothetical protein